MAYRPILALSVAAVLASSCAKHTTAPIAAVSNTPVITHGWTFTGREKGYVHFQNTQGETQRVRMDYLEARFGTSDPNELDEMTAKAIRRGNPPDPDEYARHIAFGTGNVVQEIKSHYYSALKAEASGRESEAMVHYQAIADIARSSPTPGNRYIHIDDAFLALAQSSEPNDLETAVANYLGAVEFHGDCSDAAVMRILQLPKPIVSQVILGYQGNRSMLETSAVDMLISKYLGSCLYQGMADTKSSGAPKINRGQIYIDLLNLLQPKPKLIAGRVRKYLMDRDYGGRRLRSAGILETELRNASGIRRSILKAAIDYLAAPQASVPTTRRPKEARVSKIHPHRQAFRLGWHRTPN